MDQITDRLLEHAMWCPDANLLAAGLGTEEYHWHGALSIKLRDPLSRMQDAALMSMYATCRGWLNS